MCGIVGYITKYNKDTCKKAIGLLKLLEYRGYDSAGIGMQYENAINIIKKAGPISNLENYLKDNLKTTCVIAHTRWATHGIPNESNAHPFMSNDKSWAIVHNGIIENYVGLRQKFNDVKFTSETDSEVVAHMLKKSKKSGIEALIDVCNSLQGSFAICAINSNIKNTLFLAKSKSPLYIAKNNFEIIVASDPICFAGRADEYFMLEDMEFCEASFDKISFFDKNGKIIKKHTVLIDLKETNADKKQYEHFMLKEIMEEGEVLKKLADVYSETNPFKFITKEFLNKFNKIIFIGCGTAYHAGLMGSRYINTISKLESHAYIASEYRYAYPLVDKKTLVILVSQSGETADTLSCNDLVKSLGATTIALTNVLYSSLSKKADFVLPVCAGVEISVASTKAYVAQIAILNMLAKHMANILYDLNYNFIDQILSLQKSIKQNEFEEIINLANEIKNSNSIFYIGRDLDSITAKEASLKLKEITYINSSSYPAGELKHGFLALIDNFSYVFVLACDKKLLDKTLNGAYEAKSRGAKIILITSFEILAEKQKDFYKIVKLDDFTPDLMQIISVRYFQLLAYYVSVCKGINPDKPRNLAKSVTVE